MGAYPKDKVEPLIREMRGKRVILDADLARLYGVTTKRLNEAVSRNRRRFPEDFLFRLDVKDAGRQPRPYVSDSSPEFPMWSQIATTSPSRRRRSHVPWAFTEHGALMAANVLRSERAVQMSIYVIRAFVGLRERAAGNEAILRRLAEIDKTLLQHDSALRDLYRKLLPLLQPPADPPKRRIGFHTDE